MSIIVLFMLVAIIAMDNTNPFVNQSRNKEESEKNSELENEPDWKSNEIIEGYYVNNPEEIGKVGAPTELLANQDLGIELIELRTPNARHFQSTNGSVIAILSLAPTSFLSEDGKWYDQDTIENPSKFPQLSNYNSLYSNFYGFTRDRAWTEPELYMYPDTEPDNYIGIGWDNDLLLGYTYRGFAQWDTSSVPDTADILDVGLAVYLSDYTLDPFGNDVWQDHEIWLEIFQMSNKPSDFYGNTYSPELYDDAYNGALYFVVGDYIRASQSGWKPSSSTYYNLNGAEIHLKNQLSTDWFAVGLVDLYEEDNDEGVCLLGGYEYLRVEYNRPPEVYSSDITVMAYYLVPGKGFTVFADYHDPDGYEDIQYCWLVIDNDNGGEDLELRWNFGSSVWMDPIDAQYINNVVVHSSANLDYYRLTWEITLNWNWTEDTSVDFGINVEDKHGYTSGWAFEETDLRYDNDIYLEYLYLECASDWNGNWVEDGDWIGPNDQIDVYGAFYFEGMNENPKNGEIIAQIYANGTYTGISDDCGYDGSFSASFISASVTDLDYLIDAVASSIPDGGSEIPSAEDGKMVKLDASPPFITSPLPDDSSYLQNTTGNTISWFIQDLEVGTGNYKILLNGSTYESWKSWTSDSEIIVNIDTDHGLGKWNYTIMYRDALENWGTEDTVIITILPKRTPIINGGSGGGGGSDDKEDTAEAILGYEIWSMITILLILSVFLIKKYKKRIN